MSAALQHRAQSLASAFPPLLIEAERVAASVQTGIHGRCRAGLGETFWQFRRYEQGDDTARIDWRQSARTDKVFVREQEWEAAQTASLWADSSGSMRYASDKNLPAKAERAQLLMLALASLLLRGGEKVVWLADRPVAVHGRQGLERIASRVDFGREGQSRPPAVNLARHGHMVLASDFLMPPEELEDMMRDYAARNLRGILVHILDPAEENLAFDGRLEMLGCEDEAPLLIPNAGTLREAYAQRMAAHKAQLINLAESAGWFYLSHVTDRPPHAALMKMHQYLAAER